VASSSGSCLFDLNISIILYRFGGSVLQKILHLSFDLLNRGSFLVAGARFGGGKPVLNSILLQSTCVDPFEASSSR
jgi:hypothetical protein